MTQRRCRNCRYWGRENSYKTLDIFRECLQPDMGVHIVIDHEEFKNDAHQASFQEKDATLVYGESCEIGTALYGPEFGCIHWERKETP